MNITQAKAALRKLYGNKAMWRYDERAPLTEEREAIRATLPELKATKDRARELMAARRKELLSDPLYLELFAASNAADKAVEAAISKVHWHRVQIGENTGYAFHIRATGDNWQEAIDNAKKVQA